MNLFEYKLRLNIYKDKLKGELLSLGKQKTHDEYVKELSLINPNVIPIDKYNGVKNNIRHKCLIHNYIWDVRPDNLLQGKGCPLCRNDLIRDMKVKSDQQYLEELSDINSYIIPLESYKTNNQSIYHLCLKHNVKWKAFPSNILNGCGCRQCGNEKSSKSLSLSHSDYCDKLKIYNPNVIPIDKYINNKTRINHRCLIHNYEWLTTPSSVLQGGGCPLCRSEKITEKQLKTHEEYIEELSRINSDVECLDKYINATTAILHRCKICNHQWNITPANLLFGYGCPQCNISHGEKYIKTFLDNNNITYIYQKRFVDCKDSKPLPFDFYLVDYNKCIEYDGLQHFKSIEFFGGEESFNTLQLHDKIKTEYCEQNNISLLRIPYYEKDIETQLEQFIFN